METKYKSKKMEETDEFKSHYVVWKQNIKVRKWR